MSTSSPFTDDVCRTRYDRIAFGIGTGTGTGLPRRNGTAGAGATRGDVSASGERKWLRELGAMSVLEAELQALSVDGPLSSAAANQHIDGSSNTNSSRHCQAREREWYKSCLETMLDDHYEVLDGLEDRPPTSRIEAVTSTSAAPAALSNITISKDTAKGQAFHAVGVSTLLQALPGLAEADPPVAAAAAIASGNAGNEVNGNRAHPTTSNGFDASANIMPSRGGTGSLNGDNGSSGRGGGSRNPRRHHGAPDDAAVGILNPYATKCSKSGNTHTSSNVNAGTSAGITPFLPSSVRGAEGAPAQRGSDAGIEGSENNSSERPSAPPNGYQQRQQRQQQQRQQQQQQQQRQQGRGDFGAQRNVFGGPFSGPIVSHHQQPQQQQPQQSSHQQQQATPRYGDRDIALANASRGAPVGGWGGRDPNQATAWAARDPTPQRGGLPKAGSGVGTGQQGQGQGHGGEGMRQTTTTTTGPFKTARQLRAADIAPGGNRWGIGNNTGNNNDLGRKRGGDQHQQRSWDGRDSGRGGGGGAGGGMWGGSGGSDTNQEQRGYGNSNGNGYDGGGVGGNGSCNNGHDHSRCSTGYDDHATSRAGGQGQVQGPPITPRLPNGSGLVRKRKFVPPGRLDDNNNRGNANNNSWGGGKFPGSEALGGRGGGNQRGGGSGGGGTGVGAAEGEDELPEELAHLEKAMVDKIMQEVQQKGDPVTFDQIAGLEFAKKSVIELVCWPMERPDIFTGLRSLPKGLLLFGPPGTGKTLIGKAIAHQSGATFFSISASSLCSKWIGEGEKMVRTLFAVAGYHQPAVIFIDEVDSMLSMRSADENEASRRLKTEFLIQLDGAGTKAADRVLVVGATNRPQELDEAARRRFVKRLYVPLPDKSGRRQLMNILLKTSPSSLTAEDVEGIVDSTEGFSGADLHSLCTEAAMGPVRDLGSSICTVKVADVPPMETRHFTEARQSMRPSVGGEEIQHYLKWNEEFGSFKRA